MIPGPVTARVPVDPGTAQRQPAETATEAADAGASFADLLAAMLAPGAAGMQPQAAVSNPAEAVFERLDAAEIFNETGLFRGAAPLPSAEADGPVAEAADAAPVRMPAPAPDPQAELRIASSQAAGEAAPVPDVAAAAASQSAANGNGRAAAGGPIARIAQRAMQSLSGQPVASSAAFARSAKAGGEAGGSGRVSSRAATIVAQLTAARAGAAAAQVSVQAVEGGISVMARVDKLSREERDRLRTEIGELLARHGFGSAGILLNGEAWPLPQREEN